jgi:hypothetical protein
MRGRAEGLFLWTWHSSDCQYADIRVDRDQAIQIVSIWDIGSQSLRKCIMPLSCSERLTQMRRIETSLLS